MIAVVTVLLAFVLGLKMKSRLAANVTYAVAYLWAFTFQTLYLLLGSLGGGSDPAFQVGGFPLAYGLATLAVFAVGFALVELGHWLATRRSGPRSGVASRAATPRCAHG